MTNYQILFNIEGISRGLHRYGAYATRIITAETLEEAIDSGIQDLNIELVENGFRIEADLQISVDSWCKCETQLTDKLPKGFTYYKSP